MMNNNKQDWENDFWDEEPDEDEEGYNNGVGIDANNDETFDNAAEWNEDEHEELIARDSILSQTQGTNNNSANKNNNRSSNNNDRSQNSNHSAANEALNMSSGNNGKDMDAAAFVASIIGSDTAWNSTSDSNNLVSALDGRTRNISQAQSSYNEETNWRPISNPQERLLQLQLQQQHLLLQSRLLDQERLRQQQQQHQLQQQQQQQISRDRQILQQREQHNIREQRASMVGPLQPELGPKILTVDELERQLRETSITNSQVNQQNPIGMPETSRRAGWSPFGGKDLFTSPEQPLINLDSSLDMLRHGSLTPQAIAQQQRLILQQHQILQQQQQQLAMFKQQQMQLQLQQRSQGQSESAKLLVSKGITVEELERQIIGANRSDTASQPEADIMKRSEKQLPTADQQSLEVSYDQAKLNDRHRNHQISNTQQERRNGERHDRFDKQHRDSADSRDHRDRRENRNNNNREFRHRHVYRREPTIIPPQAQLKVIDRVKQLHSIKAKYTDDYLQDRVPSSSDGFHFKRHSIIAKEKVNHDGILTEKERSWLTRVQEKIQGDCDDNLDQDYYYLLYFNRSSMTDEAAQKPGPGCLDRRFIPRERLLYNSGI